MTMIQKQAFPIIRFFLFINIENSFLISYDWLYNFDNRRYRKI